MDLVTLLKHLKLENSLTKGLISLYVNWICRTHL